MSRTSSPSSDVFRTPPTTHTTWESDTPRTPRSNIFNRPNTSTRLSKPRSDISLHLHTSSRDRQEDSYPIDDQPSASSSAPFLEQLSDGSGSEQELDGDDLEEQLAALGVLDDGEDEDRENLDADDQSVYEEDWEGSVDSPLAATQGSRGKRERGRRKRRLWDDGESDVSRGAQLGISELIPPLVLSHPLFLLPILPLLPHAFLPAGVVLFLPSFIIVAVLSACANIVAVYLARYLNVTTFQDTCKRVLGVWGLQMGRGLIMAGMLGISVAAMRSMHPILVPVLHTVFPGSEFLQSRVLWTSLLSLALLPPILPARLSAYSSQFRQFLILLLPLVVFLVIGRTVEIVKAAAGSVDGPLPVPSSPVEEIVRRIVDDSPGWASRGRGLFDDKGGIGSAAAFTLIAAFFSPHMHTLATHSTLSRTSRSQFYIPVFAVSLSLLVLCLPFVLVPYYLLPATFGSDPTTSPSFAISRAGIFAIYPTSESDHWLNLSRVSTVALLVVSTSHWVEAGREMMIRAVGAEREGRAKAGRWVGGGIWVVVGGLACLGGWVADKVEVVGVLCVILVGWLLPSIFFVTTFHVWTPLAIVFPSHGSITQTPDMPSSPAFGAELQPTMPSTTSAELPYSSFDALLARKERQLQKKRTGRRLWQDLIVFVGIFPVGALGTVWTVARLIGIL